eukprot:620701_1
MSFRSFECNSPTGWNGCMANHTSVQINRSLLPLYPFLPLSAIQNAKLDRQTTAHQSICQIKSTKNKCFDAQISTNGDINHTMHFIKNELIVASISSDFNENNRHTYYSAVHDLSQIPVRWNLALLLTVSIL